MGSVASGKSTCARLLSQSWGARWIEEDFGENPFLEKFYKDPAEYSFRSQFWFLEKKVDQLSKLDSSMAEIIDPALEMDRLYAKTQHQMGWMNKDEWNLYQDWYDVLKEKKNISEPDIYFVVNAPNDILYNRIQKRGRESEMWFLEDGNRRSYFEKLRSNVQRWHWGKCRVADFPPTAPINSAAFDLSRGGGEAGEFLVKDVENWIRYYFLYRQPQSGEDRNKITLPNNLGPLRTLGS